MVKSQAKKIKIRLKASLIGSSPAQRKIVKALGLNKISQVAEHMDSATIMGMVNKVSHLVEIVD